MSLREYFGRPRLDELRLDTLGAGVVLALALILFPLRFFVSQFLVHTIPVVVGIASGAYLLLERRGFDDPTLHRWRLSDRAGHVLRLAVLVGLAGLVLVGTVTGGRTIPFYGVAALVGALVFVQILLLQRAAIQPAAILVQVVAFAVVVRGVALATTPGLIGVDAWIHLPNYAAAIRQSGELTAIADSKYYAAPLYHLLVVVGAEALNVSLRLALYATLGIVMPLSVLVLYCTTRCFLAVRWALFATATFAVADHVVRWGIHVIPTSMGLVFFLGVFYGVGKLYASEERPALYGLVLLFSVATILTHQISTFVLLVFLAVGAAAQVARWVTPRRVGPDTPAGDGGHVNFVGLLAVVLPVTLLNWSRAPLEGTSFLEGMVGTALASLESSEFLALDSVTAVESDAVAAMVTQVPMSIQLLDGLGFLLLLLVTLVGAFALLGHTHLEVLPVTWIGATAVMLFVVLGLPLFGQYFLIPMRWYAFLYVPMVVLAAYGLQYLEVNVPARQFVVVLVLFSLLFPGAMLANHKATHDDPVHDDYYHRFAYSESELAAAETIAAIHPGDATLRTDHPYFIYLRDAKGVPAGPIELGDDGGVSASHVVYRDYQTDGAPQVEYGDAKVRVQLATEQVCGPSMDVLYANSEVRYCRAPSGGETA